MPIVFQIFFLDPWHEAEKSFDVVEFVTSFGLPPILSAFGISSATKGPVFSTNPGIVEDITSFPFKEVASASVDSPPPWSPLLVSAATARAGEAFSFSPSCSSSCLGFISFNWIPPNTHPRTPSISTHLEMSEQDSWRSSNQKHTSNDPTPKNPSWRRRRSLWWQHGKNKSKQAKTLNPKPWNPSRRRRRTTLWSQDGKNKSKQAKENGVKLYLHLRGGVFDLVVCRCLQCGCCPPPLVLHGTADWQRKGRSWVLLSAQCRTFFSLP